ncbi:DUF6320 domain-containing protein [Bacillus massiliigorillae]|uniref:DUF6320 domain-containing protein n=1 Tax=Bacillus massiliigorillae TaxID=1243664 RepID=UPI0003A4A433|nr:DUF6320 domain-containing protein [Bacillus massiliigorillae]
MIKCTYCNIFIDSQHSICPLCTKSLNNDGVSISKYPSYLKLYQNNQVFTFKKLYTFLTLTSIILSFTINLLTLHINSQFWSVIVIAGLLYAFFSMKYTLVSQSHIGKKILFQYLSLSAFLFIIDVTIGFDKWSINYVIPLLGIGATILITTFALVKKSLWHYDIGYIIAMLFINICPFLFFIFKLSTISWPSIICIVYSFITVIGMIIFFDRQFTFEIKKRFHL